MNNDLINIRLGLWHFHFTRDWKMRVEKNEHHIGYPYGRFEVYDFFGLI